MTRVQSSSRGPAFIPLFWRLFIPNASVLAAACVVLILEPANGRIPALVGGLALLLTVNLVLMRRTLDPLTRVMRVMEEIDPLDPGRRLPVTPAQWEVTALAESFNRMLERLESERRESGHRALLAQEGERRRVAAELHDEIGQQLTALVLDLERLRRSVGTAHEADLERATTTAHATLGEVRRLAHRLRPEVLDELGLVPALRNLCDRLQSSSGLMIHRTLPSDPPALDADRELAIYRIAQESLTNVLRHARASTIELELAVGAREIELAVADDGTGMAAEPASGIRGMRERALAVGARLEVGRSDAGGTRVLLRIPRG